MQPEDGMQERYFETDPQRERLLLLGHLVRNARDPLYLRGPAGAGKTVTARRLAERIAGELRVIEIDLAAGSDLITQAASQLGAPTGDQSALLRAVDAAVSGGGLLLLMDKADSLAVQTLPMISHLQDRGARLLFIGRGGLGAAEGEIDCQFIDLPAFDLEQSAAFLRQQAGQRADDLDDEAVARLHRQAEGRPGPLIDALATVDFTTDAGEASAGPPVMTGAGQSWMSLLVGVSWMRWLAGGVAALVLVSALLFQDSINAWFEPADGDDRADGAVGEPAMAERRPQGSVITPLTAVTSADGGPDQSELPQVPPGRLADALPATTQQDQASVPSSVARPSIQLPEISASSSDSTADQPDDVAAESDLDPLEAVMRDAQAAAQDAQAEAGSEAAAPKMEAGETAAVEVNAQEVADAPAPVAPVEAPGADANGTVTSPAPSRQPVVVAEEKGKTSTADQPAQVLPPPAPVVERAAFEVQQKPAPVAVGPDEVAGAAVGSEIEPRAGSPKAPGPAPVIDRVPGPASSAAVVTSSPSVQHSGRESESESEDGTRWLAGRAPGRYTLQIIGARDREAVQAFIDGSGISPPYAIFVRDLGGRPWYSLVVGDYPDRETAVAAKTRLPAGIQRADIWPRTFGSIPKN